MSTAPIVVEQTYDAPIGIVWMAITNQDLMPRWFFEQIQEFRPEVGFETEFDVECEGQVYRHQWKVTEVVPEKRIVYDWLYGGYAGQSSVAWELSESPEGTTLELTHTGGETFPRDNPIFSRENGVKGWTYFVQESLKGFLEGHGG